MVHLVHQDLLVLMVLLVIEVYLDFLVLLGL